MLEKFVLNARNSIETNVRFERFGSICRQTIGIIVAFFLIAGLPLDSIAEEKKTEQVVFFSAPVAGQTEVYSSPSSQAYATGAISEGEYVEIFFRLPQGYCAIKPPQGSFSWVNGKFLRVLSQTDGQIELTAGKKAPARIGGDSPETSSVVQVGLQNKQRVKIIGKTTLPNGSVWYKIAPPPGEFRWIKTCDLASDPALEQIPEKLTFQSEYLSNSRPSRGEKVQQDRSDELDFTEGDYPNLSEDSTREFKREVAKLNADVFKAIQKNPSSPEELNLLAKQAERLFDEAPSDDDRFFVQSIYEIVKKNQASASRVGANPFVQNLEYNGENAFQTSAVQGVIGAQNDGASFSAAPNYYEPFGATSFPQTQQLANGQYIADQFANGQFVDGQFANGQFVGDQFVNGQFVDGQFGSAPMLGSPFVDSSNSVAPNFWNTPNVYPSPNFSARNESKGASSRMEFAFSGANNPFISKKREARIVYGNSKSASRTSSGLSKLPSLFSSSAQAIVPPSSYNRTYGIGLSQVRQNSKLLAEAQKKKNEEAAFALAQKKLNGESNRQLEVAQTTPKAPQENETILQDENATKWRAAKLESSESNAVNVANLTPKTESNNSSKIRQTSAFTPVASPTNQGFNAVGILTTLSDASEGSPRYALKSPSHAGGIVYLVPAEGVSFAPYVGQNVGVKGTLGTVAVGGRSQKLVVVGSIFPL